VAEEQEPKQVQGDCPKCGRARWANVVGERRTEWGDDDANVWGHDTYRLLECAGCKLPYYQRISVHSEDVAYEGPNNEPLVVPTTIYFPSLSKRARPDWLWLMIFDVDKDLVELFGSLYTALDHNLTTLAASGVRTAFDVATTTLGIDPTLTFEEKIQQLKAQGRIGQYEQEDLATMVDAANAAMHRGWKPSPEELDTMMTTLERFIHHSFMLKGKAAKLKEKVPPKPKRNKQ
jgi:Domain of unknown function (DUF4145)